MELFCSDEVLFQKQKCSFTGGMASELERIHAFMHECIWIRFTGWEKEKRMQEDLHPFLKMWFDFRITFVPSR